jgi:hypothetical protein
MHDMLAELITDAGGDHAEPGLIITNMAAALDQLTVKVGVGTIHPTELSTVLTEAAKVLRTQAGRLPLDVDCPSVVQDRDGDVWERRASGAYECTYLNLRYDKLDELAAHHGPLYRPL